MDASEWPLKRFNIFAIPVAITMAIISDSFWIYLVVTGVIGMIIANVMATLFVGKFKQQLARTNPLMKLSAKIQGFNNPSLLIRFIIIQSLSGAMIIIAWFSIAWGVVYLFS
ncbi:MAG: hypothetical protein IT488_10445 [Gammaproteobacteria bacterium]|nr:hypothetical protein [Gammaproteobacteria bacterium]